MSFLVWAVSPVSRYAFSVPDDQLDGWGGEAGPRWVLRRCDGCRRAGCDCHVLYLCGCGMDSGGNQAGLMRRSFENVLETAEVCARSPRRAMCRAGHVAGQQ